MQITERLNSLKGYIAFLAYEFTKDIQLQEDYAQEATLAVWLELQKAERAGREVNDSYLRHKAKWTLISLVRKARVRPESPAVFDDVGLFDQPFRVDHENGPIAEEVRIAVSTLPERQREYCYLRFWRGWSVKSELAPAGYNRHLWYDPKTGARRVLRDKLAHLADVA